MPGVSPGDLYKYVDEVGIPSFRARYINGCFSGSIEEFTKAVQETHGDSEHGKRYMKIIGFFKIYFE